MLRRKGLADGLMRNAVNPLSPQTAMPVFRGSEVQSLSIRGPVCPVLWFHVRDADPGTLGDRSRPTHGCDHDAATIRWDPHCKAHPAVIGRKSRVQHRVFRMLKQRGLLMRSDIEKVDLIRSTAEDQ